MRFFGEVGAGIYKSGLKKRLPARRTGGLYKTYDEYHRTIL